MKRAFSKFTRNADFFDGLNLNTVCKLMLKTALIGGDFVVLFDHGLIEDSGKLLIYEPDEIGNTTEAAIIAHYGKGARQSQGRVYNQNGRCIGVVVSRSQRGKTEFDPDKCYFLHRNPNGTDFDNLWIMPRNVFRPSQGRGVSQAASALATILKLEDLTGFELDAAKKNAQTLAVVYQPEDVTADIPSAFGTDFSNMTPQEIAQAVQNEVDTVTNIKLNRMIESGAIYEVMPDGAKLEMLKTERPNPNMPAFIDWLCGRGSSVFGLSRQFATLNANG